MGPEEHNFCLADSTLSESIKTDVSLINGMSSESIKVTFCLANGMLNESIKMDISLHEWYAR